MKRGSALLIVIGLVSFMFVSAIGFSIYMRTSRVPSSYLRRNIAARHLVRAALAKAIGELEGDFNTNEAWGKKKFYGIHDDPFPGILFGADATERTSSNGSENGDYWLGRVFMPFGSTLWDNTVSTLTLEALAYLPPAIIDDVRRLSRYTRTAIWRSLPYGAGRYAYCAVNVSDLFDINKLRASEPRDSGLNRITLAPLCVGVNGNFDMTAATSLDTILDKIDSVGKINGNAVPFVSLADFNLVAGVESQWAPFMNFIGGNSGEILGKDVNKEANALFITDTWFPTTNTVNEQTASYDPAHPFSSYDASSFLDVINYLNPVNGRSSADFYMNNLGIGIACLYDYLDSDSRPISLVLPTTEAVPMIVGASSPAGLSPTIDQGSDESIELREKLSGRVRDKDGNESPSSQITVKRMLKKVSLSQLFAPAPVVTFVAVNPFKRLKTENRAGKHNYYAKALLRVWLAHNNEQGAKCRQGDAFRPGSGIWQNENSVRVENGADGSFVTYVSSRRPLPSLDVTKTDDALYASDFQFPSEPSIPLYYEVTEETVLPAGYTLVSLDDPGKTRSSYRAYGDIWNDANQLKPWALNESGLFVKDSAWEAAAKKSGNNFVKTELYNSDAEYDVSSISTKYRIYASLWIQVLDGSDGDRVVDMVPACAADDREFLRAGEEVELMFGSKTPLLNFKSNADVGLSTMVGDIVGTSGFADWASLYAVDPRYNYAPEDWFATDSITVTVEDWKKMVLPLLGKNGRDHDIFMFVSDQEYLQSMGELQFLPWIENLVYDRGKFGNYAPAFGGASFLDRKVSNSGAELGQETLDRMANGNRFWRTYCSYSVGGAGYIANLDPYEIYDQNNNKVMFPTGSFKINPFSQDDRVLRAAFEGTPFDWYVASTNYNQQQDDGKWKNDIVKNMTLDKMMEKYSFGEDNDVAKLSSDDMKKIFSAFKNEFRAEVEESTSAEPADWLAAYNGLNWAGSGINDDNKNFLGAALSETLHGVDRKYLYSFWRECFDNRQQLFLIFVRAEPASVGGGGAGRVPSQMGGRAVALVWRDPEPQDADPSSRPTRSQFTSLENFLEYRGDASHPPHRTRVLFYHQFD